MSTIRTLSPVELPRYRRHLLRLDDQDRRLRFGRPLDDDAIGDFVGGIDTSRTRILARSDRSLEVVAAVEVCLLPPDVAEFAFSVERPLQGHGLGTRLFERALLAAQNRGIRRAVIFCRADNMAMRRLARRLGMTLAVDGGECEGHLDLEARTPMTLLRELVLENRALCDFSLRANSNTLAGASPLKPAA